jgi:hypothetical protein
VGNKITPCHPRRVTWHSKMTWPMTWHSKMTWPMTWHPSGPVWHLVWHPVGHPVRPPSGTPSGTPVLSRGSGRPSISEPLDRCPFGPPTVALPFTYIKPSNPPLHHFLHSPICIGTCDCVAIFNFQFSVFGFRFSIPKIPKLPKLPELRGLRGRSREKKKVFSA